MLFLAHAGHWAIYVLYAVPIVIVIASIVVSLVRQRRRPGEPEGKRESRPAPPRPGE